MHISMCETSVIIFWAKKIPNRFKIDPGCPVYRTESKQPFPVHGKRADNCIGRSSDFRFTLMAAPSRSMDCNQWL